MSLEELLNTTKEKTQDICDAVKLSVQTTAELMTSHPLASASIMYFCQAIDAARYQVPEEKAFQSAFFGFTLTYVGCQLAKEYLYRKKQALKKENSSLPKKCKNYVLNNRTIASIITGAVAVCAMNSTTPLTTIENLSAFLPTYVIMNTLLKLAKYQQELQEVYKQKKELVSKVQQAVDYLLERPSIISTTTGAITFAHFYERFTAGYQTAPAKTLFLNAIIATASYAASYFTALSLASIFHSQSKEYAKLAITAKTQKFLGKYEQAIETLSKLEKIASLPARTAVQLEKAEIMILQGKYDAGLLAIKDVLNDDKTTEKRNPFELLYEPFRILGLSTAKNLLQFLACSVFQKKGIMRLGLQAYKDDRPALAKFLLRVDDSGLETEDNRVLRMLFFDSIGDIRNAQKELKQTIKYCKPELFKQIARSSDEIFEYDSSSLTRTIVFKKSKNPLDKEYEHTQLFYDAVADKNKVAHAISCAKTKEEYYLAVSRIKGKTLAETEHKEKLLDDVVELLCETTQKAQEIAAKTKIAVPEIDYSKFFDEKFVKRMHCSEEMKTKLREYGAVIPEYLSKQQPTIIHGNPHSRNIIASNEGLCLIDFGDVCSADFGLDLEQAIMGIAPNEERITQYETCISLRGEQLSKETMKRYAYASAFKASHLFARSVHYCEDNPAELKQNLIGAVKNLIKLDRETSLIKFEDTLLRL